MRAGVSWRATVDRPQIDRPRAARECLEGISDIGRGRIETPDERPLDGAVLRDQTLKDQQHGREVGAACPAMHQMAKRPSIARGIEFADERRRRRPHHRAHRLDGSHHRRDAAKRQPGRDESDDFAVVGTRVPPDDLNRVERGLRMIERRVQAIELVFHRQGTKSW